MHPCQETNIDESADQTVGINFHCEQQQKTRPFPLDRNLEETRAKNKSGDFQVAAALMPSKLHTSTPLHPSAITPGATHIAHLHWRKTLVI